MLPRRGTERRGLLPTGAPRRTVSGDRRGARQPRSSRRRRRPRGAPRAPRKLRRGSSGRRWQPPQRVATHRGGRARKPEAARGSTRRPRTSRRRAGSGPTPCSTPRRESDTRTPDRRRRAQGRSPRARSRRRRARSQGRAGISGGSWRRPTISTAGGSWSTTPKKRGSLSRPPLSNSGGWIDQSRSMFFGPLPLPGPGAARFGPH
jgi:hypothetical protein